MPVQYKELLIGCGADRTKKVALNEDKVWKNLTTLDSNKAHNPDMVWDLEVMPLPLKDNEFSEIHAYEVLEHTGQQGDWYFFFRQFSEFWRILKPNGLLIGTVPWWESQWAWGDPSHKRVFTPGTFIFLSQKQYQDQVGVTAMSDFRFCYKADFDILALNKSGENLVFILRAKK